MHRMERFTLTLTVVTFLILGLVTRTAFGLTIPELYCLPGESCWPDLEDILLLDDAITGRVYQPLDPEYHLLSPTDSEHHRRQPAIIVQVASSSDVQKVVIFARQFNVRLSVYSTGHEYNGRSTADGSLQISMVKMDNIDINLYDAASDTGSSVRVQTGANWGRIYQAVDTVGKVVVGGYESTVGPGGYTAGGGNGPLSRSLGLAVDNCIAATVVLANGHIAYLNSSGTTVVTFGGQVFSFPYTHLFWAILGGGGGTFGVIIDYTFKMHTPPPQTVQYVAQYPLDGIGEIVIDFIHQLIPSLPREWYGLFVYTAPPAPIPGVTGVIIINMFHYGPWEKATRYAILPLENFLPSLRIMHMYVNHSSYLSYAQTITTPTAYRGYFAGVLVPPPKMTPALTQFFVNHVQTAPRHLNGNFYLCAEVTIGGRISELNDGSNAVSQDFRQAILSVACFVSWSDARTDSLGETFGQAMAAELYQHSQGIYQNEGAYDLPTWRQDFWGSNYNMLLGLKKAWDPDNAFYCRHCVGDDSDMTGGGGGGGGGTVLEQPAG